MTRTLCNSHARRQFVDLFAQFPEDVGEVLERYSLIWKHEADTKEARMTPQQRLDYHRAHSLPVMAHIQAGCRSQLDSGAVEANSALGKAMRYFLNHYDGLTGFCTLEGAQLDNNLMEGQLKMIVRGRKNFGFFKTLAGAAISDIITSVIATAVRAEVNSFDYLTVLQRHAEQVKANPHAWLPWNDRQNL